MTLCKERKMMAQKLTSNTLANFTYGFGNRFLLAVAKTSAEYPSEDLPIDQCDWYVWSDPDYSGDNTIIKYKGNPLNFVQKGFMGRAKGIHSIGDYCGPNVKFVDC